MCTEKSDSMVRKTLESLCCNNGWSYGVFWCFGQRNSLLLTMEDAYFEEHMGVVIDNMLLQVHMLGNGIVGQAAFTKKHRWMFSNAFQDDSEIHQQFSSGIQTVVLIPVESQGVVQFGSTQKIPESMEFVDQTKRLFQEMKNGDMVILPDNMPSSSNNESFGLSGVFASLISSENSYCGKLKPIQSGSPKNYVGTTCSSTNLPQLSRFTSDNGRMMTSSHDSHLGNQLQMAGAEVPFKFSSNSNTWLQKPLVLPTTYFNRSAAPTPCISTWSNGHSTLTSFEQQLPSETRLLSSQNVLPAKRNSDFQDSISTSAQSAGGFVDTENRSTSPNIFQELFQAGDFTTSLDNCSPWTVPSPEQWNSTVVASLGGNLTEPAEVSSVSSGLDGAGFLINIPANNPANSVQSSITNTFNSDTKTNFLDDFSVDNDLFDNLGLDFECGQADDFLNDILMPVGGGGNPDFTADASECISEKHVGSVVGSQERLFSKLGLELFLDGGITDCSNSIASSIFVDELSSASKRRKGNSSVSGDQVHLTSLPCFSGNLNSLKPAHALGKSYSFEPKKEVISKSEIGSWIGDSYSVTGGSNAISQPKKFKESTKIAKTRAKPGTRKKPKDRVQIEQRIAELRKLIPNGLKMSIDSLLAQTIKHMLFLQGVTKHAEKLKQVEERKEIEMVPRDNSSSSSFNAMWACEVGAQTMVDPVDIKDLSPPGQKLIQMLCEEKGFFLEIIDIIQGFGLTILKGVMEVRENKIWSCFIVEAEASRHVTKNEIYVSLHQLLHQKSTSEINVTDQIANVLNGGTTVFNDYHQHLVPLPISLAETLL